jgi:hypothetical protein
MHVNLKDMTHLVRELLGILENGFAAVDGWLVVA